jgi:outer membrane protein TolC
MKSTVLSAAFVLLSLPLFAQTTLSLKECVQIAIEKNINVETARIDQEKSRYKVAETRSSLLPQVTVGGTFQDNLKLPTTMLPGVIIGQPGTDIPVQMGSNYTASASATLTQVLFNKTALSALNLAKQTEKLNELGVEKISEQLANEVSKLYFLALTTQRQIELVNENIARVENLQKITKLVVDNGFGKKVDVDRINVNLENLYTQLSNTQASQEQQLNTIKFMLKMPLEETIVLTDSAEMSLLQNAPVLMNDFSNHIDIQMLESQKKINLQSQKVATAGYWPSLSFVGQYAYQGLRSEFGNYFNNSDENQWFGSSYIGLNLSIPIFDGLDKRSKSRQAKLDYQKTSATLDNTKEQFSVKYKIAMNNYKNNQDNVTRQKKNIDLAESVYNETALKYKEGLATLSDLLSDEMGLNNAQSGYLNALYNFKEAELNIMSLNGEIKSLMKN